MWASLRKYMQVWNLFYLNKLDTYSYGSKYVGQYYYGQSATPSPVATPKAASALLAPITGEYLQRACSYSVCYNVFPELWSLYWYRTSYAGTAKADNFKCQGPRRYVQQRCGVGAQPVIYAGTNTPNPVGSQSTSPTPSPYMSRSASASNRPATPTRSKICACA